MGRKIKNTLMYWIKIIVVPRDGESQLKKNCNGRKYPEILVLGEEKKI